MLRELILRARLQKIPTGTTVFWEGDACHSLALLLSGSVRAFKTKGMVGLSRGEIEIYLPHQLKQKIGSL